MKLDVIKAQKGDKEAFCRLIKQVEPSLYRMASSIMKSEQECLDAAQEAVLKAYLSIGSLKSPQYFKTWITRILIRECTRILKERKKVVHFDHVEARENHLPPHEQGDYVQEAIEMLEDDHRIVITLYYFQDFSVKEIAKIIQQSEGTVKSRLSRARKKLEKVMVRDIPLGGMRHESI
ncbi:hypothetical protein AC623_01695 [Bacillus sp. FJAT-27231]|nr:hypothetical protein AC623_01695 [Bacillus sp. FJAT-27231]